MKHQRWDRRRLGCSHSLTHSLTHSTSPLCVLSAVFLLRRLLRDAARQTALRQKEIEAALKGPKKEHEKGSGFASIVNTTGTSGLFGKKLTALAGKTKKQGESVYSKKEGGGSALDASYSSSSPSAAAAAASSSASVSSHTGKMREKEFCKRVSTLTQNSAKVRNILRPTRRACDSPGTALLFGLVLSPTEK